MVPLSMTLSDLWPGFEGRDIFEVEYLKNGDGYYGTLIGSHGRRIECYNFRWPWVTSDTDFKVVTFLDIEYLRNDTR